MKRILLSILAMLVLVAINNAQDEGKGTPVYEPFFCGYLIDAQTTYIQPEKTLGMAIQHKFGTIKNGKSDIWGLYSSANVRLALDYVPYKNLQVGYGLTRTDLVHDFNIKYTLFEQTQENEMPVAVGFYGNMGISGSPDDAFGDEYQFTNRFSYFGQIIIGRKFSDRISLQTGVSFSHFNHADTSKYNFDRIGIHMSGRVKLTSLGSFVFNYDQPLKALQLDNRVDDEIKPNFAVGWEIATITHSFLIYMGYSKEILPQYYMLRERKPFEFQQFNIGFTITRMWNF